MNTYMIRVVCETAEGDTHIEFTVSAEGISGAREIMFSIFKVEPHHWTINRIHDGNEELAKPVQRLVIIRGIPGSGKTTYAKSLGIDQHYEADMYFDLYNGGQFDPKKIKLAHEWCQNNVRYALTVGADVVVSNTFTRKWEMEPYLKMAQEFGITPEIVVCRGTYQNVHGVPPEKVKEMADRFEE
jgi:hypothetical protein